MIQLVLQCVVNPVRAALRAMQSPHEHVGIVQKIITGAALIPLFGFMVVVVRSWCRFFGPIESQSLASIGVRFPCRLPDMIQMYINLFGVWEPDLTAYVAGSLSEGDIFVDVGANVGYFSMLASTRVGETGGVVAIEPCPAIARMLQQTLTLNPSLSQGVRVIQLAVSDHEGEMLLHLGPVHNLGLTSPEGGHKRLRADATVRCAPLGSILGTDVISRARLIKIDVEGGEPAVLRGMLPLIPQMHHDVEIMIELSPAWWGDQVLTPDVLLRPWVDAGFRVYEIKNNYWPWRYLWPKDVQRGRRLRVLPTVRRKRYDLILSRRDVEEL